MTQYERMFYRPSVRALYREEPCKSALNRVRGMPFGWSLNPYMGCAHRCSFCYVRAFEERAGRPGDSRYGHSIRVKVNVAEVLRVELARHARPDGVAIGAATDPYQPAEGRYRLTRACIEALGAARTPFSIITRGPLAVRDADVILAASGQATGSIAFSIPTLDERVWRTTEPGTAPPQARLRAVRLLADRGVRVGVAIAPILPGLSDQREQLARVVRAAREAGADSIWSKVVYLAPGTREHFFDSLALEWPEELARYERIYDGRIYPPAAITRPIGEAVRALAREHPDLGERSRIRREERYEPVQLSFLP